MAGASNHEDEEIVRRVYVKLQAASCPLLEGLHLEEAESMLDLLCVPSPYRTEVLMWMYTSINPNFNSSKTMIQSCDSDDLFKAMAAFGQELMLCRADELGLFRERAVSVQRQLRFLEELVSCISWSEDMDEPTMDEPSYLDTLFSKLDQPISELLKPTVDPWPTHMKILQKNTESSSEPVREDVADVATLLQETQSALEQLKSECEFLDSEEENSFSPDSLQMAARDLHQVIGAFSNASEADASSKDPLVLAQMGKERKVFQSVHRQLLALTTEMELLKEITETSASVHEDKDSIQACPWFQNTEWDDSSESE